MNKVIGIYYHSTFYNSLRVLILTYRYQNVSILVFLFNLLIPQSVLVLTHCLQIIYKKLWSVYIICNFLLLLFEIKIILQLINIIIYNFLGSTLVYSVVNDEKEKQLIKNEGRQAVKIETTETGEEVLHSKKVVDRHTLCALLNKDLKAICKAYDLDPITTHSFRISKITSLLEKGYPLVKTSKLMGHKNISTTERYYYYQPDLKEILAELEGLEDVKSV